MIAVNSDQIVTGGNPVVNFLVPAVLFWSCYTGVSGKTILMATAEIKPRYRTILL